MILVRTHSEVLDCLASVSLASKQQGIASRWCSQSQLIESECLTTRIQDTLLSASSESESGDGELWKLGKANIICDGTDNDDDLTFFRSARNDLFCDAREGNWGTVDL